MNTPNSVRGALHRAYQNPPCRGASIQKARDCHTGKLPPGEQLACAVQFVPLLGMGRSPLGRAWFTKMSSVASLPGSDTPAVYRRRVLRENCRKRDGTSAAAKYPRLKGGYLWHTLVCACRRYGVRFDQLVQKINSEENQPHDVKCSGGTAARGR